MSKQRCECPKFKTMCGGQALIEGIMMRGPKKQAVVVRKPDGELEIQEKELRFIRTGSRFWDGPSSGEWSILPTPCTTE